MSAAPVTRIVIVGGGTAGWMTAAALSRILGRIPGLSIRLVESDAIGTIGVGEATIPDIVLFNRMLGIDEAEFLRETRGTYKLGIEFVDWLRIGHSYVHPFGDYGIDMEGLPFHHFWLRGRELGDMAPLDEYAIASMAAQAGKFMPGQPQNPNSPLSRLAHAYQFDAGLYARFLRRRAEAQGVARHEGRILRVEQDGESGHIDAVHLENGERIDGELFIDCSGFRSLLLGETLGVPFTDWTHWLPCDRAIALPCAHKPGLDQGRDRPVTRSTARAAGWQWRIPLQHRIGNGHVYSSAHMTDDEALTILIANLDGEASGEPNHIRFAAGHRREIWKDNVVAIGLAAGFLEPLESTAIHLVQMAIGRLLTLWPARNMPKPEITRFNRETIQEYTDVRDLLILHYKASERDDSIFWKDCRALPIPDTLAARMEMFGSTGRLFSEPRELFTERSWLAVMVGQGVRPGGYHAAAAVLSEEETLRRLGHIRKVITENVAAMPGQGDYLRSADALSRA